MNTIHSGWSQMMVGFAPKEVNCLKQLCCTQCNTHIYRAQKNAVKNQAYAIIQVKYLRQ